MIRVAVAGACGRMGSGIISAIRQSDDIKLVCPVESDGNPNIGRDAGEAIGIGRLDVALIPSKKLAESLRSKDVSVLVDFTNAAAAVENAKIAAGSRVNVVIGTTGFSEAQKSEIERAVRENRISAVVSPNMSTGVNLFFKLSRDAAGALGGYEVEIIEAHHDKKKDSPSGTALRVGELIAKETGAGLEKRAVYGRRGMGERGKEDIGFHSIRAGDIVGEHTVLFVGEGERIEITHRAHSRQAFVAGALKAIRFIHGKRDGKIYSTWDVLGIS